MRSLVSLLLIFQLSVGVRAATNSDSTNALPQSANGAQVDDVLNLVSQAVQHSNGNSVPALGAKDIGHISDWHFITYERVDGKTQVKSDRPLTTITADNHPVSIFEPLKELTFKYDRARRRFEINHVMIDKKTGEVILLDSQVCENIEITAEPIADENGLFFASTEGLHFLPWFQVLRAYSLAGFFIPSLVQTRGAKITELVQLSRNAEPAPFLIRRGDGGLFDHHKWLDLGARFDSADKTHPAIRISREEIMSNWEAVNKWLLFYLQLSNPDMQNAEVVQKLLADDLINQDQLDQHRLSLLDEKSAAPKFDVLLRALAAHGQIMGLDNYIGLLKKDPSGLSAIGKLRNSPRDVFSANPAPNGLWSQNHQAIRQTEEIARQYGINKTWPELLADYYTHRSPEKIRAEYAAEESLKNSRTKRWRKAIVDWSTPQHLRAAAALTVVITAVGGAQIGTHGAVTRIAGSLMLKTLEWSTHVSLLSLLTTDIYKSAPYLSSPSHWLSSGMGLGLTMAFVPLSFYLAGTIAKAQGFTWDKVSALFNLGLQKYALLNKPLQMMAQNAMGRGAMYSWIDNNMNPVEYPEAMKAYDPRVSKEERAKAAAPENLQDTFEKRRVKKSEATLLAAAFLSKASEKSGRPIDIGTILMASQDDMLTSYTELMTNPTKFAQWSELSIRIYKALADLGEPGVDFEPADSEMIQTYILALTPVVNKINQKTTGTGEPEKLNRKSLRDLWRLSKRVTSANVFGYLLFGKPSYEFFQKWRNAPGIDKTSGDIAANSYVKDYVASDIIYALAAPEAFGAFVNFDRGIHFFGAQSARILFDQSSQVFIYGFQGAVDPLSSASEQAVASPALNVDSTTRSRTMTFREALRAMAREYPNSSIGLFGNHAAMQTNVMRDFQPRFLVDFASRYLGLIFTNVHNLALSSALLLGAKAFALSNALLLQKMSFGLDWHSATFIAGYATVWPLVFIAGRLMRNAASKNKEALALAFWTLEVPLKVAQERELNKGEMEMLHHGVDLMQSLFVQDKKSLEKALPAELLKHPTQYTVEEARKLLAFANQNVPVPTVANDKMDTLLNIVIGSIGSVLLFNPVSQLYYDPHLTLREAYTHLLAVAAGAYLGTAIALNFVLDPLETRVREVLKKQQLKRDRTRAEICRDVLE